jgi:hypothetical protein
MIEAAKRPSRTTMRMRAPVWRMSSIAASVLIVTRSGRLGTRHLPMRAFPDYTNAARCSWGPWKPTGGETM